MVHLTTVQTSNKLIASTLPHSPVAIFVGGTKGIGAHALRAFAKHASSLNPRIDVLARNTSPAIKTAQELCPNGTVTFLACDASQLRDVERICGELTQREKTVNLLFMSQGTLDFASVTPEGLPLSAALAYYSRIRFVQNLMPSLLAATGLKRVVNVFTGTKEGAIDPSDLHAKKLQGMSNMVKVRAQGASMLTLAMEVLCQEAGGRVGFVHNFPGFIKSDLGNTMPGFAGMLMRAVGAITFPFLEMKGDECAERQLFGATSARFDGKEKGGVECEGVEKARGTDGMAGSGSYSVDEYGENADIDHILKEIRDSGDLKKMWDETKVNMDAVLKS